MDAPCFDRLTRALATPASRRRLLRGLAVLGLVAAPVSDVATARKRKKKVKFNEFGCVNVGKFCKHDGQCCSGICQGKKGKKKCKNHDAGTGCQKGDDFCLGIEVECTTATGEVGACFTTTGNAPYCRFEDQCTPCSKDADCQELCGLATAVCVKCPDCLNSEFDTACAGPSPGDCEP